MPHDLVRTERALTALEKAYLFALTVFRRRMYLCPDAMTEEEIRELIAKLQRLAKAQRFAVADAQSELLQTGIEVPDRWLLSAVPNISSGEGKSPWGDDSTLWCFVSGVDERALNKAVLELRQCAIRVSAGSNLPPALAVPPPNNLSPVERLFGWPAILDAIKQPDENKESVRKLNEDFDGPIQLGGRGSKPHTVKHELIQWWNNLDAKMAELAAERQNEAATLSEKYAYGRSGHEVLPEIGGSVKKSRRKR